MTITALPTAPQTRASLQLTAMRSRGFMYGLPKTGKTTTLSQWAPDSNLLVDTHRGTEFLEGEHLVQHVTDWLEFEQLVKLLTTTQHPYKVVTLDVVDDLWKMADRYVAGNRGQIAAALVEFGKGTAEAEALFRREIGKLLAHPGLGVWLVGHADLVEVNQVQRYVPALDKRVRNYIIGAVGFVLVAERIGPRSVLHTQASARFEAGARVWLPEPLDMDARTLYAAIQAGLNGTKPPKPVTDPAEVAVVTTVEPVEPEAVEAEPEPVAA